MMKRQQRQEGIGDVSVGTDVKYEYPSSDFPNVSLSLSNRWNKYKEALTSSIYIIILLSFFRVVWIKCRAWGSYKGQGISPSTDIDSKYSSYNGQNLQRQQVEGKYKKGMN